MRKIKFRVWDKEINKMITQENVDEFIEKYNLMKFSKEAKPYRSDEWDTVSDILVIFDYFQLMLTDERFEIMEYVGLKDKNGKEIYEGDIVEIIVNNNITDKCIVEFKNGVFGVEFNLPYADLTAFTAFHNTTFEVIGNIYDNKELGEECRKIRI